MYDLVSLGFIAYRLFNAKSSLYIYIKFIGFGLFVVFMAYQPL